MTLRKHLRTWKVRPATVAALAGGILLAAGCTTPPGGGAPDAGPDPEVITPNTSGWWRDDVFYEVFVRSFHDSDGDGNGDLAGLTAKLDVLNDGNPATTTDLGVDALWLMPIHPSPSYHGYDVTDYRGVNPEYGTLADFDALTAAAHARGMKVILDLVLNHTSSQHPWFVSARQDSTSPWRDHYVWRPTKPTGYVNPTGGGDVWHAGAGGYYYGVFFSGMPDLNWKNPAVEAELLDVMKFWLARGVDGFRVDAARYLVENEANLADQPETHELVQRLRHALHQEYPQALLVAEAWTSSTNVGTYYGEGNEYQLAFSFEIADAILKSVNDGTRASIHQANYVASTVVPDRGFEAPFLRNHDHVRVMRQLGSSPEKARLAAALLFAQPGTPFLYYGEELGMVGGPNQRDEDKRTPMLWSPEFPSYGFSSALSWYRVKFGDTAPEASGTDVSSQQADPGSLWNHYRALIALRHAHPALSSGASTRPTITGGGDGVFAMLRELEGGERVLFVANLSAQAVGAFTVATSGTPTVLMHEGLEIPPTSKDGALSFAGLGARSFSFLRLD
ncbi:MAG: DUF3459 domain-containing protein [Myxococcaceae bacterium]|nr:DUF3459 domain-containing protein [Myxococcaceae bacterium]